MLAGNDDSLILKRSRGRPRSDAKKQVVQRLLDAAEMLLREHSHFDLTERQIASVAGVHEKMIHYYFGDRYGLLFDVVANYFDEVSVRLQALDTINAKTQLVTRNIIDIVVEAYYPKYWVISMAMSEFARGDSPLKLHFMKKFGPRGMGISRIQQVIERLIECGIYDRRINVTYAAMELMAMIMTPLTMAPFYGGVLKQNQLEDDGWVNDIADLFDRRFRTADI